VSSTFPLACAVLTLSTLSSLGADELPHRVAYDDAGRPGAQSHRVEGGDYTYATNEVPVEVVPPDSPARTVAFGERVAFIYGGLNTGASYRVRLVLLSDGSVREQRVRLNGRVAREKLVLPMRTVVRETIDVPPESISGGLLEIEVEKISGPNAVLSEIAVESTDPAELKALSPVDYVARRRAADIARWVEARPRYTARPDRVSGVRRPTMSLNGSWLFHTNPPAGFATAPAPAKDWKPIEVPGEWVMQGFDVTAGTASGYRCSFGVPKDWSGRRIVLRFDAVYSDATVWLNGRELGRHEGGFTPFEFDVTDDLQPGRNDLAVAVKNESLADTMASGSRYSQHPLGGISRKVTLFAVPPVHLSGIEITAAPDESLARGELKVSCRISNAGGRATRDVKLGLRLQSPDPKVKAIESSLALSQMPAGDFSEPILSVSVDHPLLWDTEHPNLYTLTLTLSSGEVVKERIGFKRTEVRGNQLFVNNRPVKLRGGCRHETHPTRGRSLTPELWRRDAELYREANFNHIRTSHYPPAEEFIAACAELGLFVECEAPLCWSGTDENSILTQSLEMVQTHRNRPSVLYWSLANESGWYAAYQLSALVLREIDPTRPRTFNYGPWGGAKQMPDEGFCEIGTDHYPGPGGPDRFRNAARPISFGEYCHLNAYNRFELAADPGVRDAWGRGFRRMWDGMFASQGVLGGSLWAAMDDTFHLPDGRSVGYGTWGPLDNWRRPKPEYWHAKKTYSPVRIDESIHALPAASPISLAVLNQSDFSNLREFDIRWTLGRQEGRIDADVGPHERGTLTVAPARAPRDGEQLRIVVRNPRGFIADEYAFAIGQSAGAPEPARAASGRVTLSESTNEVVLASAGMAIRIERSTGRLSGSTAGGVPLLTGGPHLMILPLNGGGGSQMGGRWLYDPDNRVSKDWKFSGLDFQSLETSAVVVVRGSYSEAEGAYTICLDGAGTLTVAYDFTARTDVNPRQVGLVFDAPRAMDTLSWERDAPYTVYPPDHIGRAWGSARAFGERRAYEPVDLRKEPSWPWSLDAAPGGTQDFRATRENIRSAGLADARGRGIEVLSDGTQHARAWVDGNAVKLLVADYSNAGAEGFFRGHAQREDRPIRKGEAVRGCITLRCIDR
jgi:beta-galactosidase